MEEGNVIMLSGGVDSSVLITKAVKKYGKDNCVAIHYNYGQPTEKQELDNAKQLANYYDVKLIIRDIHNVIGQSGLTDENQDFTTPETDKGVSTGYVPFRNMLLLTVAAGVGENEFKDKDVINIWIGAQAVDVGGYADCREEFLTHAERALDLSSDTQIFRVERPFVFKDKTSIIKLGNELKTPFEKTISCYKLINDKACGKCSACEERKEAFEEAGIEDPMEYN